LNNRRTHFDLLLGVTVGSTIGLIGVGGAIIAEPDLLAALGLSANAATTSSKIIVSPAALPGALIRHIGCNSLNCNQSELS
jgi:uncharacterized membrane protein YfcA